MSLLDDVKQEAVRIANDILKQQNTILNQMRQLDELKASILATMCGTVKRTDAKVIAMLSDSSQKTKTAHDKLFESSMRIRNWAVENITNSVQSLGDSENGRRIYASFKPRSLNQTQQEFETMNIDGVEMKLYNKPFDTAKELISKQGKNSYNMEGTCGLCQCANVLRLAGVNDADENLTIETALQGSSNIVDALDFDNPYPEERGGTTSAGRQEILSRLGLETYILPISVIRQYTVNKIAQAVYTGHGVILSVDVERLWRNGQSGGHAISLLSVSSDRRVFVYSDTGTGEIGTISSRDLAYALTGRPANITTNIIR